MVEREETVKVINSGVAGDGFDDRKDNRLAWNPEKGLKVDNDVVLSPATGLAHEADHANDYFDNPQKHNTQSNTPDKKYGTTEEKRVITGSEQKTARANGEIKRGQFTRTGHYGANVIVNGVTSTTIDKEKTKRYEKEYKKAIEKSYSGEW